jgi:hypothetical protein
MLAFGLDVDGRPSESMEVYNLALSRLTDPAQRAQVLRSTACIHLAGLADLAAAIDAYVEADQVDPDGDPLFEAREQTEAYVNAIANGRLADVPVDSRDGMRPSHWLMVGEQDSAVVEAMERMGELPFGRVIELRLPSYEALRADPRLQEWMAERDLGDVTELRTPEAERTRPMVLREAGE